MARSSGSRPVCVSSWPERGWFGGGGKSWRRSGSTWITIATTLGRKCADLTPEQLATRSVPPSTLSLLGLVRHLARVEHTWFHRRLRGHRDAPRLYRTEEDPDLDFNGAVGDPDVVDDAFTSWRQQIADADAWLDEVDRPRRNGGCRAR